MADWQRLTSRRVHEHGCDKREQADMKGHGPWTGRTRDKLTQKKKKKKRERGKRNLAHLRLLVDHSYKLRSTVYTWILSYSSLWLVKFSVILPSYIRMHHSYRDSRSSLSLVTFGLFGLFGLSPKPGNWSSILLLLASFFFLLFFFFPLFFFWFIPLPFPVPPYSVLRTGCTPDYQPPCSNLHGPRASRQPPFSPFFFLCRTEAYLHTCLRTLTALHLA